MPDLNVLAAYNCVNLALGGSGAHPNDMVAVRAIAVLEGVSGGPVDIREDNMVLRLNAIDVGAGGAGNHENDLDALNSIATLAGGVLTHENSLDAINNWCDNVTGILDTVSGAAFAYGLRRLRGSNPLAIRVRRISDDAELDIAFLTDGTLDTPALETFCAATDGFITTWYDLSGNGINVSQSTSTLQYQIVSSGTTITDGEGNIAAQQITGSDRYDFASTQSINDFTVFFVAEGASTGIRRFLGGGSETDQLASNAGNLMRMRISATTDESSVYSPIIDGNTIHAVLMREGTIGSFFQGTTARGTATVSAAIFEADFFLNFRVGSTGWSEHFSEFILYDPALSSANRALVVADQAAFWTITP